MRPAQKSWWSPTSCSTKKTPTQPGGRSRYSVASWDWTRGKLKMALNCICWNTRFQLMIPLKNHTPQAACKAFYQCLCFWTARAGLLRPWQRVQESLPRHGRAKWFPSGSWSPWSTYSEINHGERLEEPSRRSFPRHSCRPDAQAGTSGTTPLTSSVQQSTDWQTSRDSAQCRECSASIPDYQAVFWAVEKEITVWAHDTSLVTLRSNEPWRSRSRRR